MRPISLQRSYLMPYYKKSLVWRTQLLSIHMMILKLRSFIYYSFRSNVSRKVVQSLFRQYSRKLTTHIFNRESSRSLM